MTRLVRPQTLRGFRDLLPAEMIVRNRAIESIRKVYESYAAESERLERAGSRHRLWRVRRLGVALDIHYTAAALAEAYPRGVGNLLERKADHGTA